MAAELLVLLVSVALFLSGVLLIVVAVRQIRVTHRENQQARHAYDQNGHVNPYVIAMRPEWEWPHAKQRPPDERHA